MVVPLSRILIMALLALCLTSCVDYEIGIRFDHQTHGTLTQTLHLDEQWVTLNKATTQQWLNRFEQRARALSAQVKRLDADRLQVTLPFYNGDDLVTRFNTLFGDRETSLLSDVPGLPPLSATLSLEQQNRFLALRNHLVYELDLRSLNTLPISDQGLIGNWQILTLTFHLVTPWGIQPLTATQAAISTTQAQETIWQLKPGELNHVDVVFWVPSPLGISVVVITLLIAGGYLLRYRVLDRNKITI